MRSPSTAKDDQPGPIGRRHSSTGGDAAQSVAIHTPRTTPSRSGPRKPGQFAVAGAVAGAAAGAARGATGAPWAGAAEAATRSLTVSAAGGAEEIRAASPPAGTVDLSLAVSTAGTEARGGGRPPVSASSRSSRLFAQRQWKQAAWSPLIPSM